MEELISLTIEPRRMDGVSKGRGILVKRVHAPARQSPRLVIAGLMPTMPESRIRPEKPCPSTRKPARGRHGPLLVQQPAGPRAEKGENIVRVAVLGGKDVLQISEAATQEVSTGYVDHAERPTPGASGSGVRPVMDTISIRGIYRRI